MKIRRFSSAGLCPSMMNNKFFFIFFIILSLFSISAMADYSTLYNEDFEYCGYLYSTRSWLFDATSVNFTAFPIYNSETLSCGFGLNTTTTGSACSVTTASINQETATPLTSGIARVSFNIYSGNTTSCTTANPFFRVMAHNNSVSGSYSSIAPLFLLDFNHNTINLTRQYKSTSKKDICSFIIQRPYYIDVIWLIDIDNKKTSLEIINKSSGITLYLCENINFYNFSTQDNGLTNINKFELSSLVELGRNIDWIADDFKLQISNTSISANLPAYSYCDVDTNCLTGYCVNNKCQYKTDEMVCTSSSECLSGSCINTHCTNPDLVVKINSFWSDLGIVSMGSKLLIGLIVIIAVILIVAFSTANMIAITVSGLASLFVVVYLGLFPIWIVILIIIMSAVGFFAFFSGRQ